MYHQLPTPNGVLARGTMEYTRHQPEHSLLYQVIEKYYPEFLSYLSESDKTLPQYVQNEFEEYLKCGRLEHDFLRVQCESCQHEQLVAFSCKRRGFCASCGAKRMVESAALLVDSVLPHQPIRQWVLSVPFPLRWLFASKHRAMVTGDGIDKQNKSTESPPDGEERRATMSWAMRLKRVFNIDITVCKHCQGPVRIIACIEDRQVINKILAHINQQQELLAPIMAGTSIRAPPTELTQNYR